MATREELHHYITMQAFYYSRQIVEERGAANDKTLSDRTRMLADKRSEYYERRLMYYAALLMDKLEVRS